MVKKVLLGLILAAFVAGSLAALPDFSLSVGAGGYIGGDFGGGAKASASYMGTDYEMTLKTPYFGGGGYIFLDATYAELSFGVFGGGGKYKTEASIGGQPIPLGPGGDGNTNVTNLNLGLLGKYPFAVGEKLSVFPLLGIDYQITVAAKMDGEKADDPGDNSALWFKFGGGLDYAITSNIFARFETLYGIRLPSKFDKDMKDMIVSQFHQQGGLDADAKTRLGHGLTVKLAVGYKF